jgi:hypothetical protein
LTNLIQNGTSANVIEAVFYSLKWSPDIVGVNSPCNSKTVRFILDATKKLCSATVKKQQQKNKQKNLFLQKLLEIFFITRQG